MRFARLHQTLVLIGLTAPALACSGGGADPVVPTNLIVTSGDIVFTEIGDTATITAVVRDQFGEPVPDPVLTYEADNPAVVTVSSTGVVTAEASGRTIVRVRSGELRASVSVDVEIPPQFTVRKEVQSWFGGEADNPSDPPVSGFEFTVQGSGGFAETIMTDASGAARTTLDPGTYTITESNALGLTDVTGSADIEISPGVPFELRWVNRQLAATNVPEAIINASPRAVPAGDNDLTEVRLWAGNSADPNGDALTYAWEAPGGTFIGASDEPAARVTYPGGTPRTVTLTVDDGNGNQDVAQVQIDGPPALPAAGNFDIVLIPIEPIEDEDAQAAFDLAEATWESIIRNDLPEVTLTGAQVAQCADDAPDTERTVDDLQILIEFSNIDGPGSTLAQAGPCWVRTPQGAPSTAILGVMRFDSSDFGDLPASALNEVILHEMAHVLGFGTLWNRNGLIVNPSCPDTDGQGGGDCRASDPPGPDTRFIGLEGSEAYQALGGVLGADVPVENGDGTAAGPGSRDGHWREIIFGTELMTPRIQGGRANPLSVLTAASLTDMGYLVDYAQVDNYDLPGQAPFPSGVPLLVDVDPIDLSGDLRTGPIFGISPDGRVRQLRR